MLKYRRALESASTSPRERTDPSAETSENPGAGSPTEGGKEERAQAKVSSGRMAEKAKILRFIRAAEAIIAQSPYWEWTAGTPPLAFNPSAPPVAGPPHGSCRSAVHARSHSCTSRRWLWPHRHRRARRAAPLQHA